MPNQDLAKLLSVVVDHEVFIYILLKTINLENLKNIYNMSDLKSSIFSKRSNDESVKMSYK